MLTIEDAVFEFINCEDKKMRYSLLGNTGLKVSEMALGTWGIGGAGWDSYSDESRMDAIRAAIEQGVNFIDTAPAYNAGAAERYIGQVLHDMGTRKDMIISTKCGNEYINGSYVRSSAPDTIIRECEESLKNLKTDYIDIYLIHWPDPNVPFEETMEALNKLKQQGKILHVGVSNFSKEQIVEASRYCAIEVYQPQYSMVYRADEEKIKWASAQGIGTMTYGALGGGILSGKIRELKSYTAGDNRNRFYKHFQEPMFSKIMKLLEVMEEISEEHEQVPLSQIALNWAVQKDFVSACIVGAQSRARVEENCASFTWTLTAAEMEKLDTAIYRYIDY